MIKLADLRKKDQESKKKEIAKDGHKKNPKELVRERAEPQIKEATNVLLDLIHLRGGEPLLPEFPLAEKKKN